ncbi:hypothetical protein EDD59_11353 [Muricomes intestini]|uniref:Uncharacterized protein n=1 Tax=Muricomes intestini TaxID=1796634 RepID=A0A4R3K5I7_9FIRM|nr:hypothetical protein EDD59_11353 [Muricomes intestini]
MKPNDAEVKLEDIWETILWDWIMEQAAARCAL